MTQRGQWEIRVDYQTEDSRWHYAHYNQFSIGSASEEYQLIVGEFTGDDKNWFSSLNGRKFSTLDNVNDLNINGNCAVDLVDGGIASVPVTV